MEQLAIQLIRYAGDEFEEVSPDSLDEVYQLADTNVGVVWVNIDGLHETEIIESICRHYEIHRLTMEDILSVGQRPKLEEHAGYLHMVLRMFRAENDPNSVEEEQLSFLLKDNLLISFQERTGDVFDGVRRRLREGKGLIRHRGADYLLYALLDSVVDHYYLILELYGEKLEEVEALLLQNPEHQSLNTLHHLRRELLNLRRSVYPLREVISGFEKLDEPFLQNETRVFIRDLYDHTIQVIETTEVFREMGTGLLDLYMNSISNKMNEVMKVLTIIATIFIPLTFIVGVYGMNFNNMPELEWHYGYFIVMGFMLALALMMLVIFRVKKWL